MTRYGMVIDVARCTACYGCFAACKDEHWDNDYAYSAGQPRLGQFWINLAKAERGTYPYVRVTYMPVLCQQCDDPPCAGRAENGAVRKEPNGIVVFDPAKAVGQRQIVDSCPYGVAFWNEKRQLPQKCTFCAHRLEEGKPPRCAQICPSEAIVFGDLDDPASEVSRRLASSGADVFHPEWNTGPRVYYANLHRVTRHFIAGAVVLGDVDECAEGATVSLTYPDGAVVRTVADAFGHFEFDGLEAGEYTVEVRANGYGPASLVIDLRGTWYLGDIVLNRA